LYSYIIYGSALNEQMAAEKLARAKYGLTHVTIGRDSIHIKLANTWLILNSGGGPNPDKPEVLLETPSDLNI
jgi:hypothetical protein